MKESLEVDKNYEFMIITKEGNKYSAKEIYEKINRFNRPEDIKIIDINNKETKFILEKTELVFYRFSTKCFLENEGINTVIYSLKNLELILDKLKYEDPVLCFENKNEIISLNKVNLYDLDIYLEKKIIIKKNIFLPKLAIKKFQEQKLLIEEYCKKKYKFIFPYKVISYNIKNYLQTKDGHLEEPFYYIDSKERQSMEKDISKFIKSTNNYIFPIVGPYGIGKSLTALIVQKNLYKGNIKSLYINIKYYYKNTSFEKKIETLINECFYLCSKEEDLVKFQDLIKRKTYHNIWLYLNEIYNSISDYSNYLFIIDQYKKEYDIDDYIFKFPKIHIFLLSSINDKDIKKDIEKILKNETPRLNYIYKKELIENTENIIFLNKEKLIRKIPNENDDLIVTDNNINNNKNENINDYKNENIINNNIIKIDLNDKFQLIISILKLFGLLPRYISLLLNKYDNVIDFLNEEYKNIFKLYMRFFKTNSISKFRELTVNYFINKNKKSNVISSKIFLDNLNDIPLKYVNYYQASQNNYELQYSFPLSEEIFNTFYIYDSNRNNFEIGKEDSFTIFENILKVKLRCCDRLKIDGYFEVRAISNFNLENYYKYLNKSYFLNKSNIFITQTNRSGKDFDFCIYKPNISAIIFIQVKYCINDNNILSFFYYKNIYKKYKNQFEKKFNVKIEKVYLLYFSSYKYNENNKKKVLKLLNKNQINCLFFNEKNMEISFDFQNNIDEIHLDNSFILFPEVQDYKSQWEGNKDNAPVSQISQFLRIKTFKKHKEEQYKNSKKKLPIEDSYYEKFFNYFQKEKLISDDIFYHLGKFNQIYFNSFGYSELVPELDLYLFLFENSYDGINFNGKLGLIYVDDDNKMKFLDINSNEGPISEKKFISYFFGCSYAVGLYNRNKN